jgi:hypothetical protein
VLCGGNRSDAESRAELGRLELLGCNFLGVKLQAPRLERAGIANYHVKQNHAFFLAGDMIGFADYELVAMAAKELHAVTRGKRCASSQACDDNFRECFQMPAFAKFLP